MKNQEYKLFSVFFCIFEIFLSHQIQLLEVNQNLMQSSFFAVCICTFVGRNCFQFIVLTNIKNTMSGSWLPTNLTDPPRAPNVFRCADQIDAQCPRALWTHGSTLAAASTASFRGRGMCVGEGWGSEQKRGESCRGEELVS